MSRDSRSAPRGLPAGDGGARSSQAAGEAPVVKTGIDGLDGIIGGGLPAQRLYLIEGEPGSGKTTLSLQFLLQGKAAGESGLDVTLSETAHELRVVAQSHGWDLEGITILDMESLPNLAAAQAQYTVFHPSEVELQDSISAVLRRVEEVKPTRVTPTRPV
jgi:circadian clock protein KaiC